MKPRVLIVVQDARFKEALAEKLKQRNLLVNRSDNAQGVAEVLDSKNIDVVLLDMRRDRGEEAMQILAGIKSSYPHTEVILLSNGENIALSMEGMRKGAFEEITVPFDLDTLVAKIREACLTKRMRMAAAQKRTVCAILNDVMVATTFAEMGEFDTAREVGSSAGESQESDGKAAKGGKRKGMSG